MKIKIDPLDAVFFRDGKPFSYGEETWATSIFPPPPSVIYGALRTQYFAENSAHFDKAKGEKNDQDPSQKLRIKMFALQKGTQLLFPAPLDCLKIEEKVVALKNHSSLKASNSKLDFVFYHDGDAPGKDDDASLFTDSTLTLGRYLNGKTDNLTRELLSALTTPEPKIGIGRENSTHVTSEGKLYRADMRRLQSKRGAVSFFVEFEGLSIADHGMIKLGGEGKSAAYKAVDVSPILALALNSKTFKLYLASPALFKDGWRPKGMNEESDPQTGQSHYIWHFNSLKLKLITAIIGKPIMIGGFSMTNPKGPKPMRRAVPAGSVYWFEILEGTADEVQTSFHGQCISDYDAEQGFGLTFVGESGL